MSKGKGHEGRGKKKVNFCAIPGDPCECGENYRTNCDPKWSSYEFERLVKQKGAKPFSFKKTYEAHHILCVSCVSNEIVSDKNIDPVVKVTTWCINRKKNMIALPLWGHTVKWYCKISARGGKIGTTAGKPPFANLPQHDWDHNCTGGYTDEVTTACRNIASKIAMQKGKHDAKAKNLKKLLDKESGTWEDTLKARATRKRGGTHGAWMAGADGKKGWEPNFSMANDAFVSGKSFPKFSVKTAEWIARIAKGIRGR